MHSGQTRSSSGHLGTQGLGLPGTLVQPLPPGLSLLLPVSGIIVITDGVTSVPDVAVCETLLNQLRSGTVACSFVQVRTWEEGGAGLGSSQSQEWVTSLQARAKMMTWFPGEEVPGLEQGR